MSMTTFNLFSTEPGFQIPDSMLEFDELILNLEDELPFKKPKLGDEPGYMSLTEDTSAVSSGYASSFTSGSSSPTTCLPGQTAIESLSGKDGNATSSTKKKRSRTKAQVEKELQDVTLRNKELKQTISHVKGEIDDVLAVMAQIWQKGHLF